MNINELNETTFLRTGIVPDGYLGDHALVEYHVKDSQYWVKTKYGCYRINESDIRHYDQEAMKKKLINNA